MVIGQTVGVGIFLAPATMIRALGDPTRALAVWILMGALSTAGALCYAELATRFPQAGGGYVFLREGFGRRCAFVYGWMGLIVIDPGLTAALGIGLAQYLLATVGGPPHLVPVVAIASIVTFGALTISDMSVSARLVRWTAAAKLVIVAVLMGAALVAAMQHRVVTAADVALPPLSMSALAAATIGAFFAFGGWWELGRMAGEVESPSRTMPRAFIGGIAIVTATYAAATVAFMLSVRGPVADSDEAYVAVVGAALFGSAAGRILAAMVVIAVAGCLSATLFSSPRLYVAMARDGLFPSRLARFDTRRGTSALLTMIQVGLASGLVVLGTFDQILGYFIPGAVLFLGLSASAVLVLPRVKRDTAIFRIPLYPLPLVLFLILITVMLVLFSVGSPTQTAIGAAILLLGIPASYLVIPARKS